MTFKVKKWPKIFHRAERKVLRIWLKFLLDRHRIHKQWKRYYLDITRKYTYTKDGQSKEGSTSTYLNLTTAAALVDQLPGVYQFAKNLQDNQGVAINGLS